MRDRFLLDGQRLPRQRRLVDVEVLGVEEPRVRRDHVAGREPDDVARDERAGEDLAPRSVAQHGGGLRDLGLQCVCCALRPVRLHELHEYAEDDNRDDDRRVGEVSEDGRRDAREEQDRHERAREALEDLKDQRLLLEQERLVRTEDERTARGFGLAQSDRRRVSHRDSS